MTAANAPQGNQEQNRIDRVRSRPLRSSQAFTARIVRGSTEVGGVCIELAAEGERLVLDAGLPLDDDAAGSAGARMRRITAQGPAPAAVVVTHGHLDHFGLVKELGQIPLFIGRDTSAILRAAETFSPAPPLPPPAGYLVHRQPLRIGPFTLTPHLVDHSAFDSYALHVQAAGRGLLYTGDLRAHGRKPDLFAELLQTPIGRVDALLLEGTRVGGAPRDPSSEREIESAMVDTLDRARAAAVVFASGQNIDRIVTLYRAARRTRRSLVIDLYTASLLRAIGRRSLPGPWAPGVRVIVPQRQKVAVVRTQNYELVNAVAERRAYLEEITQDPSAWCLMAQPSSAREIAASGAFEGAVAVWSMWPGYLCHKSGRSLVQLLASSGLTLEVLHASGHASRADLRRIARAFAEASVIPVHTDAPGEYPRHFRNVHRRADGVWWQV